MVITEDMVRGPYSEQGPSQRHMKLAEGPHKGKWVRWFVDRPEGSQEYYLQGKGKGVNPNETKGQFFRRAAKSSKIQWKKGGTAFGNEQVRIRNNIDNWTRDWINKHIGKYDVTENALFKKELAEAWKKELNLVKNVKDKKYINKTVKARDTSRGIRLGTGIQTTSLDGLPLVTSKDVTVKGSKPFKMEGFDYFKEARFHGPGATSGKHATIFYDKVFAKNKLRTNPKLFNRVKKYMDFIALNKMGMINPKTGQYQSAKMTKLYQDIGVDKSILHLLGNDSGLGQTAKYDFFNSFNPAFSKAYNSYMDKILRNSRSYNRNVATIQKALYPGQPEGWLKDFM